MRTAAPEQITAMLVVFETLPWPAGKDVAGALADELGWTVSADLPNGVHYVTALATNDRRPTSSSSRTALVAGRSST